MFCEGGSDHLHRVVEQSMMTFTCATNWKPSADDPSAFAGNATETKDYNELATLLHVSSDDAIKHLLTRGTHREFGTALFAFLAILRLGRGAPPRARASRAVCSCRCSRWAPRSDA